MAINWRKLAKGYLTVNSSIGSMLSKSGIPGISQAAGVISGIDDAILGNMAQDDANSFNAQQAQLNRDFQREERLASQEFNLDMWNKTNEYNSIGSQLQRAEDAGVAPSAVLGTSTGGLANPVTTTPMSGATASAAGSIASDLLTRTAVTEHLLAQTRNLDADTANKEYELRWNTLSENERLDMLVKQGKLLDAEFNLKNVDADVKKSMYIWYSRLSEEDIKLKQEQLNILRNQNLKLLEEIKLTQKQTESVQQDIYESEARVGLIKSQTEKENATAENIDVDTALKQLELDFSSVTGIPINAPEFQVNLNLWKEGKMWDYYNKLAMNGLDSLVTGIGNTLNFLGRGVKGLFSSAKQGITLRNPSFGRSLR